MINPKDQKCIILGLQGGGKTVFAKECVKKNNMKVLVFSPHWHDFKDEPDENFYFYRPFGKNHIEQFMKQAIELGKAGVINGVLIDEFDMIFKNNFDVGTNSTDMFANHRHYGLSMLGLARRPQDIPAYVMESSKYIISFALQGENAKSKLNGIIKGFGDMVLNLDYTSYGYIQKEIGRPPEKMPKIDLN